MISTSSLFVCQYTHYTTHLDYNKKTTYMSPRWWTDLGRELACTMGHEGGKEDEETSCYNIFLSSHLHWWNYTLIILFIHLRSMFGVLSHVRCRCGGVSGCCYLIAWNTRQTLSGTWLGRITWCKAGVWGTDCSGVDCARPESAGIDSLSTPVFPLHSLAHSPKP